MINSLSIFYKMAIFIVLTLVVSSIMFLTFNNCMNSNSNVCLFLFDKSLRNRKNDKSKRNQFVVMPDIYNLVSSFDKLHNDYKNVCNNNYTSKTIHYVTYNDGSQYIGELFYGYKHGCGIMDYPNGDKYEGIWQNDKKNGFGILISSENVFIKGIVLNDFTFDGIINYSGLFPKNDNPNVLQYLDLYCNYNYGKHMDCYVKENEKLYFVPKNIYAEK